MISKTEIEKFLSLKSYALVGASRNEKKFGNTLLKELKNRGMKIYPVHFDVDEIDGIKCYRNFYSFPEKVEGLIISVNKNKTLDIVREAYNCGIHYIWIQLMSDSKEAIQFCEENNISYISKECLLMYLEPVKSIHGFHRFFKKLFGRYPKSIDN
jgi:predicted CoA-binding protein